MFQERKDEELMEYIAKGNRAAFDCLVVRHLEKTCAMAARLSGNRHNAEDIAQEAFLQLWISAPKWQTGRARFTTWFYRIVMNKSIDYYRKNKKTSAHHEFTEELHSDESAKTSEVMVIDKQEWDSVSKAITALPEKQRIAIMLCYQKEMSNKEASQIMGLHIKALEGLLSRGRQKLKDIMIRESMDL